MYKVIWREELYKGSNSKVRPAIFLRKCWAMSQERMVSPGKRFPDAGSPQLRDQQGLRSDSIDTAARNLPSLRYLVDRKRCSGEVHTLLITIPFLPQFPRFYSSFLLLFFACKFYITKSWREGIDIKRLNVLQRFHAVRLSVVYSFLHCSLWIDVK